MPTPIVFTCAHILTGGYDFSSDFFELQVNYGSEGQDKTTFGQTFRVSQGGLKTANLSGRGYLNLNASQNEPVLWGRIGSTGYAPVTVFRNGITVGSTQDPGYGMGAVQTQFNVGTNVGSLLPFDVAFSPTQDLVRAIPLDSALSTAWSTDTNNGTAWNLGHAATSEQLFAGFHVTTLSTSLAATISAVIQAASSSGFATSSNRVSFSAQSFRTGVVATPIQPSALSTDQPFYRSVVTVSTGTSTGAQGEGLIWMGIQ